MLTALGRRFGAFYSEKSPKTRSARIKCYGNTLYIKNSTFRLGVSCVAYLDKAHASDAVALGSNHARASIYFFNKFHFKVVHSSFFLPSGETFLRFLLYYTILVTHDENFIFHSFPSATKVTIATIPASFCF